MARSRDRRDAAPADLEHARSDRARPGTPARLAPHVHGAPGMLTLAGAPGMLAPQEGVAVAREQRADRLEAALTRLADAQARTEQRVEELAQARTEQAGLPLAQQVGRLGDTLGSTLEDLARELTPPYLAQRYGITVAPREWRFFQVDGEEVEVDFYGEGTRDGQRVAVTGEVRTRIYGRDVEAAARTGAVVISSVGR